MLNLIFLCTSLEPGYDGVGDYVRRLAGELIRQGHNIAAVALNDRYLLNEWAGLQNIEGTPVQVLRIPALWPVKRRFALAKEWIDLKAPQWLSLQYVPFGFHVKGLPFGLARQLAELGSTRKWHVMFHELWVGMNKEASLKHYWWGFAQRQLIQSLLRQLKPEVVHTQTQLYQYQLQKLTPFVNYLPLPSNIPVSCSAIKDSQLDIAKDVDILFVVFGSLHYGASVEAFVGELGAYANIRNLTIGLVLIGRDHEEHRYWANVWQKQGFRVHFIGEQPSETVSHILSTASFGITTTPLILTEKSGSVAAMLEHSLPIICVSRQWSPRLDLHFDGLPGIVEYVTGNIANCMLQEGVFRTEINIVSVAREFVHRLL